MVKVNLISPWSLGGYPGLQCMDDIGATQAAGSTIVTSVDQCLSSCPSSTLYVGLRAFGVMVPDLTTPPDAASLSSRTGGQFQCACFNSAPAGAQVNCGQIDSSSSTIQTYAWMVAARPLPISGIPSAFIECGTGALTNQLVGQPSQSQSGLGSSTDCIAYCASFTSARQPAWSYAYFLEGSPSTCTCSDVAPGYGNAAGKSQGSCKKNCD